MPSRRQMLTWLGAGAAAGWGAGVLPALAQTAHTGANGRQYAPGSYHPTQMDAPPTARRAGRKNLLAWADVRNGFQHDSITHALSVIERLGYVSQLYDTYIRTDSQPITKHGLYGSDGQKVYGHDLNDYDAIFFLGVREIDLRAQQRADLLSFVHDDGKGFVAAHAAATAFMSWPEFGELLGGRFVNHPWFIAEAPVVVEDRQFPATSFLPPVFTLHDELYQLRGVNRASTDVLLRLDSRHLPPAQEPIVDPDGDFPLAWAKRYGRGRVFYSAIGHQRETWDIPEIQRLYFEAVLWALGLRAGDVAAHAQQPPSAAAAALSPALAPCLPPWLEKRD